MNTQAVQSFTPVSKFEIVIFESVSKKKKKKESESISKI